MDTEAGWDPTCLRDCVVGQALDGMRVGLILTGPAGKVQWLNRSARDMLGLDAEASRGRPLGALLRDPQMAEFWQRAAAAAGVVLGEVSLRVPEPRELKVHCADCLDRDGAPLGRVLLFCDVSAERAARLELSREVTERLLRATEALRLTEDDGARRGGLTAQELRVLRLVGAGLSNDEIARRIHIAPSTVRTHLKHVYSKLALKSRAEAIRYAIQHGLT